MSRIPSQLNRFAELPIAAKAVRVHELYDAFDCTSELRITDDLVADGDELLKVPGMPELFPIWLNSPRRLVSSGTLTVAGWLVGDDVRGEATVPLGQAVLKAWARVIVDPEPLIAVGTPELVEFGVRWLLAAYHPPDDPPWTLGLVRLVNLLQGPGTRDEPVSQAQVKARAFLRDINKSVALGRDRGAAPAVSGSPPGPVSDPSTQSARADAGVRDAGQVIPSVPPNLSHIPAEYWARLEAKKREIAVTRGPEAAAWFAQTLNDLNAPLYEQLEQLEEKSQRSEEALKTVRQALEQGLVNSSAMEPSSSRTRRPKPVPTDHLATEEARFIRKLEGISGHDTKARSQIQAKLKELQGTPVKKAVVRAVQQFLKGRGLAVLCSKQTCQKPASLLWHGDRKGKYGGYLKFSHSGKHGEHEQHENFAEWPALVVVKRLSRSNAL